MIATAVVALATTTATAEAGGLPIPPNHPQRQRPSDAANDWQDIRDLLTLSSIIGSKAIGSGSSDPGSPSSTTTGGVRDKKPGNGSSAGNSHRLPRFLNSSVKGEKTSGGLRPPGNAITTSPVQIQLHLLASGDDDGSNTLAGNQVLSQIPRRHSLER